MAVWQNWKNQNPLNLWKSGVDPFFDFHRNYFDRRRHNFGRKWVGRIHRRSHLTGSRSFRVRRNLDSGHFAIFGLIWIGSHLIQVAYSMKDLSTNHISVNDLSVSLQLHGHRNRNVWSSYWFEPSSRSEIFLEQFLEKMSQQFCCFDFEGMMTSSCCWEELPRTWKPDREKYINATDESYNFVVEDRLALNCNLSSLLVIPK